VGARRRRIESRALAWVWAAGGEKSRAGPHGNATAPRRTAKLAWAAPPMQAQEVFRHELTVRAEDVDVLGHASNIAFVRWIQEVAIAHSTAVGFDLDAYMRLGAAFVVARHEVDYLRPALLGDRVQARTWI